MDKNLIIPVFLPHEGCPHQCVFCNQNSISGTIKPPTPDEVRKLLAARLGPDTPHAVVAFYGGSFTALPREVQQGYLSAAREPIAKGHASYVRISTRPDCIDEGVLAFLAANRVRVIELGVQSLDDGVLVKSGRGHKAADSVNAARMVKSSGFELGIQVMAGLPGDTPEKFTETVERVVSLTPSFVRIYPALVVKGSPLEQLWRRGEYHPLSLDEAVGLCAAAARKFRAAGINIVRMGLQPGRELEDALLDGPYHPAFGHLVESALALERMESEIKAGVRDAEFRVNPAELSVYKGIKASNVRSFKSKGMDVKITADESVKKGGLVLRAS